MIINMDCVAGMRLCLADNSVDAIVTDPPYELGFMGKGWDSTGIANSIEMWREALRVLKPGGHLLAFSGSRTYHRMACAIEDAGFEIRDQIMWVYGSGFPKSLDVSRAIDKAAGAEREVVGSRPWSNAKMEAGNGVSGLRQTGGHAGEYEADRVNVPITAPATDAARQWEGWGTALKPAHEPICVARKPLAGTVAANVLAHGTGALNIDGCRIDGKPRGTHGDRNVNGAQGGRRAYSAMAEGHASDVAAGRWPANLIHDGSDEVLAAFPAAPGRQGALTGDEPSLRAGAGNQVAYGLMDRRHASEPRREADRSAARFFYCAKASRAERNIGCEGLPAQTVGDGRAVAADNAYQRGKTERQNTHPTVKPLALMQYLVRLVTPPGGLVLDPFTGSGSTWAAAKREGFQFVGFELDPHYCSIATRRAEAA